MSSHPFTKKFSLAESPIIDRQPLILPSDTLVCEALAQMNQHQSSYALITESQSLVGIFTERDVVKMAANQVAWDQVSIRAVMTAAPLTISTTQEEDIFSLVSLFRQHRIRHLPVTDESGQIFGIITARTLREALKPTDLLKVQRVEQVCTTRVIHTFSTTSVLDATQQMAAHHISCIVVVEDIQGGGEQPRIPIGIITERDIVNLQAQGQDLVTTPVRAVMNTPLLSVRQSDTLWVANQLMEQHGIRRLGVVDELGQLAGILTQSTILEALDPTEMYITIEILREQVNQQTLQLSEANERLQSEIALREQELRDRKTLENELKQKNLQLMQALEQIEAAYQAKNLFLGSLGYQLRTPLHAILGFAQVMQADSDLTPTHQTHLEVIQRNAQKLLNFIDNLLEISSREAILEKLCPECLSQLDVLTGGEHLDPVGLGMTNALADLQTSAPVSSLMIVTALAELPEALLNQLEQAMIRGNLSLIDQILEQIRLRNLSLAETLKQQIQDFKYTTVLTLIAGAKPQT